MQYGCLHHSCKGCRVICTSGIIKIGCKANLIIDDDVDGSTRRVTARLRQGQGLLVNALTSKCRIEIGDDTMIAANVIIVDSDFHAAWPPEQRWTSSTNAFDKEVVIGRRVWIGMNTVVLKGSRIGDNSIIGAGSVVSGDIPANVLAAGNPARVIRALGTESAEVAPS